MPAPTNKMTKLLNKIERHLGTKPLNLPEEYSKDAWAYKVIAEDTMDTFCRYFPNKMTLKVGKDVRKMNPNDRGWYIIDEHIMDGIEILGAQDVDWNALSMDSTAMQLSGGFGVYGALPQDYSMEDVMMVQQRANISSIVNYVVIAEYRPPNMVKITGCYGQEITRLNNGFPLNVLIKHSLNLMTIAPTKMEMFEQLAEADVARYIYEYLKYFEGIEGNGGSFDLKLSELESKASKREDLVTELKESYISFANKNQPMIFTI